MPYRTNNSCRRIYKNIYIHSFFHKRKLYIKELKRTHTHLEFKLQEESPAKMSASKEKKSTKITKNAFASFAFEISYCYCYSLNSGGFFSFSGLFISTADFQFGWIDKKTKIEMKTIFASEILNVTKYHKCIEKHMCAFAEWAAHRKTVRRRVLGKIFQNSNHIS